MGWSYADSVYSGEERLEIETKGQKLMVMKMVMKFLKKKEKNHQKKKVIFLLPSVASCFPKRRQEKIIINHTIRSISITFDSGKTKRKNQRKFLFSLNQIRY